MISGYLKNQRGATLVLVTLFMLGLLGFTGLVIDVGNLYMQKSRMQTVVDMAALAGANVPGNGQEEAEKIIEANKEDKSSKSTTITSEIDTGKTAPYKFTVTLKKDIPMYIMGVFGIKPVTITAYGVAQSVEEASKYTVFSKSKQDVTFKNSASITGSVYSGGSIKVEGNDTYVYGDADVGGTISPDLRVKPDTNGYGGNEHTGVNRQIPFYPAPPLTEKTRTIKSNEKNIEIIIKDKKELQNGIYVETEGGQTIILNFGTYSSAGAIRISGTGTVVIKGVAQIDTSTNPLFIYGSDTGTVMLNMASTNISATIYVPNGTVKMNSGSCTINDGCVIADYIECASTDPLICPSPDDAAIKGPFFITGPTGELAYHRKARLIE